MNYDSCSTCSEPVLKNATCIKGHPNEVKVRVCPICKLVPTLHINSNPPWDACSNGHQFRFEGDKTIVGKGDPYTV